MQKFRECNEQIGVLGKSRHKGKEKDTIEEKDRIPSRFLSFSGSEPTSPEECGIEEFLFQKRGARLTKEDSAVRLVILIALRGNAQEFKEFVGVDIPLDDMFWNLKEKYWKEEHTDVLLSTFYELLQEEGETIRQFAEPIETNEVFIRKRR